MPMPTSRSDEPNRRRGENANEPSAAMPREKEAMRRRRTDHAKAADATDGQTSLGWYELIKPAPVDHPACGGCGRKSPTVPAEGELCATCWLLKKSQDRANEQQK